VEVGYDMVIEDINKSGGVYVKDLNKKLPLELVTLDMELSSEKAVSRAETAFSEHNVIAYVGTTYIAAGLVNTEKNKVPMIPVACADQTVFEQGFKYYFCPLGTAPDLARNTFDLAVKPHATRAWCLFLHS
jgi:ABC-type branched-subunit amino acid transport system substrate-binding protein